MHRRRLLQLVGLVTGGSVVATGTGAFSTISTERTVQISVADDDDAYLALDPSSDLGRAAVFSNTLEFSLPGFAEDGAEGPDGEGVGVNSSYTFADLFTITNQGDDPVEVFSTSDGLPNEIEELSVVGPRGTPLTRSSPVKLTPGEQIFAGIIIEIGRADPPVTLSPTLTLHAKEANN